jgi:Phosphoglucomutase/phosphomannomutase, C-terminal domain
VQKAIEAGQERLGTRGRLVIRPSGTEPVIRVMAEGDDAQLVRHVVGDIVEALELAAAGQSAGTIIMPARHETGQVLDELRGTTGRHGELAPRALSANGAAAPPDANA